MKATDVLEIVWERLDEVFMSQGFTRSDDHYSRDADGVRQTVELAMWDYEPRFELSLIFSLRVEAEVEIFSRFWYVSPTSYDEVTTCDFTLEQLVPCVKSEIVVRDRRSLRRILTQLIPELERNALPFLNAHQSLPSVGRLMNGAHPELFAEALEPYYSMSAIIVAYLSRNPDLDQLASTYRIQVEGCGDPGSLVQYDQLVSHLRENPLPKS